MPSSTTQQDTQGGASPLSVGPQANDDERLRTSLSTPTKRKRLKASEMSGPELMIELTRQIESKNWDPRRKQDKRASFAMALKKKGVPDEDIMGWISKGPEYFIEKRRQDKILEGQRLAVESRGRGMDPLAKMLLGEMLKQITQENIERRMLTSHRERRKAATLRDLREGTESERRGKALNLGKSTGMEVTRPHDWGWMEMLDKSLPGNFRPISNVGVQKAVEEEAKKAYPVPQTPPLSDRVTTALNILNEVYRQMQRQSAQGVNTNAVATPPGALVAPANTSAYEEAIRAMEESRKRVLGR